RRCRTGSVDAAVPGYPHRMVVFGLLPRPSPPLRNLYEPLNRGQPAAGNTSRGMRRLALILPVFVAGWLAAGAQAASDGSLVVKNGAAPFTPGVVAGSDDTPVVSLRITGSVIGRVSDAGRIIIDAGANCDSDPQVVGAGRPLAVKQSDTA